MCRSGKGTWPGGFLPEKQSAVEMMDLRRYREPQPQRKKKHRFFRKANSL